MTGLIDTLKAERSLLLPQAQRLEVRNRLVDLAQQLTAAIGKLDMEHRLVEGQRFGAPEWRP